MTAENPYAPPKTAVPSELPDAPMPFGWHVMGGKVLVKPSSQFPMIDPFNGVSMETMMLRKITLRYSPRWLLAIPAACVGVGLLVYHDFIPSLFCLMIGLVLRSIASFMFPVCTLRVFFDKRGLRVRSILSRATQLLFLLSIVGGTYFRDTTSAIVDWIFTILPILWLVTLSASIIYNRRLRCVRKYGERFEIRGFSRKAIEALSVAENG